MTGVHIEGMGYLGSLMATRLHQEGIQFTWHDDNRPVSAWRASTGLVSPDGDARSQIELREFAREIKPLLGRYCEPVTYCYAQKNPPHGGMYQVDEPYPGVRRALTDAYVVDVPSFVRATRTRFRDQEAKDAGGFDLLRCHGGDRIKAQIWGWSAVAKLHGPKALMELDNPVFYGRVVRSIAYAYPLPGTDLHRIGSTMVRQTHPKSLDSLRHLHRWTLNFNQVFPMLTVDLAAPPVEGWRPAAAPDDALHPEVRHEGPRRVLQMPPLAHSGVRWSPSVIREAVEIARQLYA